VVGIFSDKQLSRPIVAAQGLEAWSANSVESGGVWFIRNAWATYLVNFLAARLLVCCTSQLTAMPDIPFYAYRYDEASGGCAVDLLCSLCVHAHT